MDNWMRNAFEKPIAKREKDSFNQLFRQKFQKIHCGCSKKPAAIILVNTEEHQY